MARDSLNKIFESLVIAIDDREDMKTSARWFHVRSFPGNPDFNCAKQFASHSAPNMHRT